MSASIALAWGLFATFVDMRNEVNKKYLLTRLGWSGVALCLIAFVVSVSSDAAEYRSELREAFKRDSTANVRSSRDSMDDAANSRRLIEAQASLDTSLARSDTLGLRLGSVVYLMERQAGVQKRLASLVQEAHIDGVLYLPASNLGSWKGLLPQGLNRFPVPTELLLYAWYPKRGACGPSPAIAPVVFSVGQFSGGKLAYVNFPHVGGPALSYRFANRSIALQQRVPFTADDLGGMCFSFRYSPEFSPDPITTALQLPSRDADTTALRDAWRNSFYELTVTFNVGKAALFVSGDSTITLQEPLLPK